MRSIWETPFVVVDVETSGSNPESNRITEIACVTVNGGEIISEFSSLVNPHQYIPQFICQMTGISNEMAFNAPEIEEILPRLLEIFSTPGAVFVAHNERFDWSFVKETLFRLNQPIPDMKRLCTLKLARRILPKSIKKGVGNLSRHLKINLENRHRAYGDAEATSQILVELLERAELEYDIKDIDDLLIFQNRQISNFRPPAKSLQRVEESLKELPKDAGVYYFKDKSDNLLYIGKAKSLKDRVRTYFTESSLNSMKIRDLVNSVYKLEWKVTGSELSALLLESREIKKYKPPFNTAEKRYRKCPFIKISSDQEFPGIAMSYTIDDDGSEYYGPFRSSYLVEEIINIIGKKFKLRKCVDKFNVDENNKPCFYYHIEQCISPCSGKVSSDDYKKELDDVRAFLSGYSNGIIEQLETSMYEFSQQEEFEKAASMRNKLYELRRVFDRKQNVPTSVINNNLILVLPVSKKERTVELFFIKSGKLVYQGQLHQKTSLTPFLSNIKSTFFNGTTTNGNYTLEDLDELRIITSWLFRKQGSGAYIYLENKSEKEILNQFEYAVSNIDYD